MVQIEDNLRKNDWWKPALEIFSQVSAWIVAPIIVALIAGKNLDRHFGTAPIIFLVMAFIGFMSSCFGIWRVIKKYIKEIEKLGIKKSEKK